MLAKRKKTVADPPRAILAVTRSGHTYRFAGRILSEGRREADTYLMGQRESDGSMWFHDGRGLVPWSRGWWPAMAVGMTLPGGDVSSSVTVDVEETAIPLGRYTWYLVLTEPESYRVVADGRTEFEVARNER